MVQIKIAEYYKSFFYSRDKVYLSKLASFYDNFPRSESKVTIDINYLKYFSELIPKIARVKEFWKINPANLNVWEGIELGKSELKHCSFLSWLFDPNANHCQGDLFLICFLESLNLHAIIELAKGGYYTVTKEDSFASLGRVDISINSKSFLLMIEAKIEADEQDNQVDRYKKILEAKAASIGIENQNCKIFFLTPDGRNPISGIADPLSWKQIADIMNNFSGRCKNNLISQLAKQYSVFIRRHIGNKYE